jgi:hypothetical protein
MSHDDNQDAGERLLADIDLHAWRVPPPSAVHRPSLLGRALAPATAPARRPRLAWVIAGIVLLNAALAVLVVILLARPTPERTVIVQAPAGGGTVDAQVRDLLQRLETEQRELEQRLAEIRELRALVIDLSDKVRRYEAADPRRDKTVARQPLPAPVPPPAPVTDRPQPVDPYDQIATGPLVTPSCDEVGCVLGNYAGACCAKFRKPTPPPTPSTLPETLDRSGISSGIAAVKARIGACGDNIKVQGKVKVHVLVAASGKVTNVTVEVTPDAILGSCVAAVVQRAVFPRTQFGGSFTYPFVF